MEGDKYPIHEGLFKRLGSDPNAFNRAMQAMGMTTRTFTGTSGKKYSITEMDSISPPQTTEGWEAKNMGLYVPETQRELVFHDTVPIEEERLPEARNTARKQKEWILAFFRDRYSMNFTPIEVYQEMRAYHYGGMCLLTSVRRAISDLTKEGKLIKCDYSERREGGYGHPNRTWRYNRNFLQPINPPKK